MEGNLCLSYLAVDSYLKRENAPGKRSYVEAPGTFLDEVPIVGLAIASTDNAHISQGYMLVHSASL